MNYAIEIIKSISEMISGFGFDVIIIVSIVVFVQFIKFMFKSSSKVNFAIVMMLGISIGIFKIFADSIILKDAIRIIMGYPSLSMLLYTAVKLFVPKLIKKFTKKEG